MYIRLILKKIYLFFYNKKHDVNIKSVQASIHARYGKNVLIDRGSVIDGDVSIGDYTYVNKNSSLENCEIGKYCSISSGVYICPLEHNLSKITTHPIAFTDENKRSDRKVKVGNDVLISLNCILLEGITVGDGAVIAAGAVVTKDVKPYEIVGGVPAHHIGFRAADETINYLEKEQWWNWDRKKVLENKDYLVSKISDIV